MPLAPQVYLSDHLTLSSPFVDTPLQSVLDQTRNQIHYVCRTLEKGIQQGRRAFRAPRRTVSVR